MLGLVTLMTVLMALMEACASQPAGQPIGKEVNPVSGNVTSVPTRDPSLRWRKLEFG